MRGSSSAALLGKRWVSVCLLIRIGSTAIGVPVQHKAALGDSLFTLGKQTAYSKHRELTHYTLIH